MTCNTLHREADASLYANNFGFKRFELNFDPEKSDADVVITTIGLTGASAFLPLLEREDPFIVVVYCDR